MNKSILNDLCDKRKCRQSFLKFYNKKSLNELIDWVKTTQEKTFKKFPASNDEKTMNENKGIKPQIQVAKETINFSQMNKESGSQGMKTTNKQMDSQNKMKLSDNKLVPTKNPNKRDETHEKQPEKERESWNLKSKKRKY